MSQITDIKNAFKTISGTIPLINEFAFDVLSAANESNHTYPLLLLKCPELEEVPDYKFGRTGYKIEFYLFNLQGQNSTIEDLWDEMRRAANDVIDGITVAPNLYRVVGNEIKFEYGQYEHGDILATVKVSFTLGTFHCYDANPNLPTYCTIWTTNFTQQQINCLSNTMVINLNGVLKSTTTFSPLDANTFNVTIS